MVVLDKPCQWYSTDSLCMVRCFISRRCCCIHDSMDFAANPMNRWNWIPLKHLHVQPTNHLATCWCLILFISIFVNAVTLYLLLTTWIHIDSGKNNISYWLACKANRTGRTINAAIRIFLKKTPKCCCWQWQFQLIDAKSKVYLNVSWSLGTHKKSLNKIKCTRIKYVRNPNSWESNAP